MADVTFAYLYPAGVFDTDGHNNNVFDATDGVSLLGEVNGRIQVANMHSSFKIGAEHILPHQGKDVHSESSTQAAPFVDNMLSTDTDTAIGYVAIPGAQVKFYIAFARPWVEIVWQAYVHAFRFVGLFPLEASTKKVNLQAFIDGVPIPHTKCEIPITTVFDSSAGVYVDKMFSNEGGGAYVLSQSHLVPNIGVGYHTLEVRLWMEMSRTNENNYLIPRGSNPPIFGATFGTTAVGGYSTDWVGALAAVLGTGYPHDVFNRVTFGCRNVIVSEY
tara:strand:+ start:1858 stop:2679 length:822 start_codon:yes stop_codon:yes gene_type:complete